MDFSDVACTDCNRSGNLPGLPRERPSTGLLDKPAGTRINSVRNLGNCAASIRKKADGLLTHRNAAGIDSTGPK